MLGVDVSEKMIALLRRTPPRQGRPQRVEGRAVPIERLGLEDGSVDLIVSNYALHHLRDRDKQVAVNEAAQVAAAGRQARRRRHDVRPRR